MGIDLTISLRHDEHTASDHVNTNETNQARFLRLQNFPAGVVTKHHNQPYQKPPINPKEAALQNCHGQLQRVCPTEHAGRQSQLNDPIKIQIETVAADRRMSGIVQQLVNCKALEEFRKYRKIGDWSVRIYVSRVEPCMVSSIIHKTTLLLWTLTN
jgi:hypothetical protein